MIPKRIAGIVMPPFEKRVEQLSALLGVSSEQVGRHIVLPLEAPVQDPAPGWNVANHYQQLLAICDGFNLFGKESWNGFRLWGSKEFAECVQFGGPIFDQAKENGYLPIYGEIPHLASLSLADGSVVATDWEGYKRPEQGWGEVIAASLHEYVRTVIEIREAYGDDGDMPADWWGPYASHGSRYDQPSR